MVTTPGHLESPHTQKATQNTNNTLRTLQDGMEAPARSGRAGHVSYSKSWLIISGSWFVELTDGRIEMKKELEQSFLSLLFGFVPMSSSESC
jgi:hypothetical protein